MYITKQYKPDDLEQVQSMLKDILDTWKPPTDKAKTLENWIIIALHFKGYRIIKTGAQQMSISRYSGVFEYHGKLYETPYFFCKETIKDYVFMFGSRWDYKGKLLYIINVHYKKSEYSLHE